MAKLELVTPEGLLLSDKEIPQVETCVEDEEPYHVKVARQHEKWNTPKKHQQGFHQTSTDNPIVTDCSTMVNDDSGNATLAQELRGRNR